MRLQPEDLISIAERSAFLYERLGPNFVVQEQKSESTKARLQQWCKQSSRGNEQRFHKRLAWDGLDPIRAENLLSHARLRNPGLLPTWANNLQTAIATAGSLAGSSTLEIQARAPYLKSSSPIAFEHLFVPFVDIATKRLDFLCNQQHAGSSPACRYGLQRYLLKILSQAAERTLEAEFSAWRSLPGARELAWSTRNEPERPLYGSFMQAMWNGGLRDLACEYPVLARWLGAACETWTAFSADFVTHLGQDLKDLETTFNQGRSLGEISSLEAGLSDRHNHSKSVLRVSFAEGLQLYYKPRNLESERAYNRLLAWLNKNGGPLELQTFKALNRGDHGWSEGVCAAPCSDPLEVSRYYQRAGMLLCLLYTLEGTDGNYQNIVAHGEHPVLVDTETLVQPRPIASAFAQQSGVSVAAYTHFIYDSVFRAGLLPRWTPSASSGSFDATGLGAANGDRGTWVVKSWQEVNTDAMKLCWHDATPAAAGHEPALEGERTDPGKYADEISLGFREMYEFLASRREELWGPDGPLQAFANVPVRFLFRNTGTYTRLLDRCALPDHLRNGIDTSICMDVLARHFLIAESKPGAWPILAAEHIALTELDIPYFTAHSNSQLLDAGDDRVIHGLFSAPGFSQVKSRFNLLSEQDLKLQVRYIRSSLQSPGDEARLQPPDKGNCGQSRPLQQALAIAENISAAAIISPEGDAAWISQAYHLDSGFWQLQPIHRDLYDGACGIALFLAALQSVSGQDKYEELARAALKPLLRLKPDEISYWIQSDKIGAALGAPSVVYSLVKISELLHDDLFLATARNIAATVDEQQISADRRFDLISGTAGCVLALLALYRVEPQACILEKIRSCAEHLLQGRRITPSGSRSWATVEGRFLSGFAHGSAGIAYALSQAYEITGDGHLRQAAVEAYSHEVDLPESSASRDLSWCQGEAGICLSKLRSTGLDIPTRDDNDKTTLAAVATEPLEHLDFPCCGNMGRVELLLEAGRTLSRPELLVQARNLAEGVVDRAIRDGHWGLGPRDSVHSPSFHQGMAGIGYMLLRSEQPGLPAVLSWE